MYMALKQKVDPIHLILEKKSGNKEKQNELKVTFIYLSKSFIKHLNIS